MNRVEQNYLNATVRIRGVGHVPLRKVLPRTLTERRKSIYNAHKRSMAMGEVFKPERALGAVWMDRFVSNRQGVNLCEVCARRYGDWWKSYGYRADNHPLGAKLGTCDGCTMMLAHLIPYYPEESFKTLLHRTDPKHIVEGVT